MSNLEANRLELRSDLAELKRLAGWIKARAQQELSAGRLFQGRWEQIFWTSFLVVIAAFYLSFAAYFGASTHAWQTEVVGVAVFLVCAVGGLFFRSAIAVGYSRTRAPQRKKYWERILTLSLEIHLLFDVLHRSFYPLQTTEDAE